MQSSGDSRGEADQGRRPISVVLVEDEYSLRKLWQRVLEQSPGFVCVGSYGTAEEALVAISNTHPDVVVMDIVLPGMWGTAAARLIKRDQPAIQILIATAWSERDALAESADLKADGFLQKPFDSWTLLAAIEAAARGYPLCCWEPVERALNALKPSALEADSRKLTAEEDRILGDLDKGLPPKQIASLLGVHEGALRQRLHRIYLKLGVASDLDAVRVWKLAQPKHDIL